MLNGHTRDLAGAFVDPLPVPRVIRPEAQVFPRITRSYTDQIEDERDEALRERDEARTSGQALKAVIRTLEAEVRALREQLARGRSDLSEALQGAMRRSAAQAIEDSPELAMARKQLVSRDKKLALRDKQIARLQASLRDREARRRTVKVGRLEINILRRRAELDGQMFALTSNEMGLLLFLIERPGEVFSTADIGAALGSSDAAVRTYYWRLQPKLEAIGAVGYLRSRGSGGTQGGYWMSDADRGEQARHE